MPSLTISLSLKSRLRSSTRGDSYGVLGFNPSLVFDFKNNYFRKSATDSTFGESITHAATTNATMTDGYGPNLVTNGTFDSDLSGWETSHDTLGGEFDNGTVKLSHTVYNSWTRQVLSGLVVGNTYEVSFSVTNDTQGSGGGSYVGIWETNSDASYIERFTYTKGVVGSYTFTFTATSTVSQIRLTKGSNTGVTNFDNVSVREAPAIKWRPHNLLTHSGDLTNANWTNNALTVTPSQNDFEGNPTAFKLTPTAVGDVHRLYKTQVSSNLVNGMLSTVTIDLKADGYNFFSVSTNSNKYAIINLSDGSVSLDTGSVSPTVTSLGNGWYRCSITTSAVSQEVLSVGETPQAISFGSQYFTGDGTSGVLVAYPHSFRSGFGGMVNNPDTNISYVPTTTTPAYGPRRGHHIYNGSAWVNEGILHESEPRTNQMLYSGDLTSTAWTGAVTVGTVTAGSPFGTFQTLSPLNNSVNLGGAQRYQIGKSITSGSTYVGWALVKYSAGSGWFVVNMYDTGKSNEQAYFNLQNGVVGSKQPLIIDHGMVDYGDGWWLCWASSNAAFGSGGVSYEVPNGDGVQSCSAADVILIAGTQFELGSTPSSYIPTTSAQVTRASETLTVPASNLPYDNTNMSIQIDGKMTYADSDNINEVQPYYWTLNGPNYIYARVSTSGTRSGQPTFLQRETTSGNDFVNGIPNAYTPDTNVPFNLASRHGSTFINGAHEGTLLTVNTTPTILPPLSATDLNLGYNFMGTIGQFRMWDEDLGDVGITEATLPSTEPSLSLTFDGSENSFIVLDWSE